MKRSGAEEEDVSEGAETEEELPGGAEEEAGVREAVRR